MTNEFLYAAYRLTCEFEHANKHRIALCGTGFFVKNTDGQLCLITNRHMIEPNYKRSDAEYAGYSFRRMEVTGKKRDPASDLPVADQQFEFVGFRTWLSDTYENDVVCLNDFLVAEKRGSTSSAIDYHIPYDLLATDKQYSQKLP
ncbi:MAG: hypothetical protein A3F90_18075 [Deltaproteobacteria bacterium RIFCSPLOWO2_12_FULL_60_19]|nr:MAG: hypothetical protein A3F90_18075 [Deltaproteobacteria bacterium RIFCSPLOWO2_12_FULL_60_19]